MMRKSMTILGLLALFVLSQSGCSVMTFSGEGSLATSLEMSNVDNAHGNMIETKGFGQRGFFLLFALIPIHVPTVSDAVGPVDRAYGIEITTEQSVIDFGISLAQSAIGLQILSTRSVTMNAEID